MAMGYGLPTKETPAYYINSKYNLDVRVVAVDAIGTRGVLQLLKETLQTIDTKDFPDQIYWIWNPSDFIDDEREKKGSNEFFIPSTTNCPKFPTCIEIFFLLPKRMCTLRTEFR